MSADYTDADVQTCIDWLFSAMHDDRQIPEMAENLLEDLVPRISARALRQFATDRVTTQTAARMREDLCDYADEIERGTP